MNDDWKSWIQNRIDEVRRLCENMDYQAPKRSPYDKYYCDFAHFSDRLTTIIYVDRAGFTYRQWKKWY